MQFPSHIQSRFYCRQIAWEGPRAPRTRLFGAQKSGPTSKSKLLFPWRNSISSGHSGLRSGFKGGEADGGEERKPLLLPVVIQTPGRASRYLWDGEKLRLVDFDWRLSERSEIVGDGFSRLFQMLFGSSRTVRASACSGELHGLSQVEVPASNLQLVSSGSCHSAAVNWLLKDGLGRLSRCIYTASLGSAFDTNLKRVRFSTSILFSLSIGVELLTPSFPQHFLLLATLANIAKSISLAAYIATGSAIHRSFAIADNLGEVSAKAQLQTVCFDNLGLMLAAVLNILCRSNKRFQTGLTVVVYPIFAAIDLFSIYQALRHVHLQTLTKDRLEIIIDTYIQSGYVPTLAEVNNKEGFGFLNLRGKKLWPIRIGCVDPKSQTPTLSLLSLQSLTDEEPYFVSLESAFDSLTRRQQRRILLSIEERAGTSDIIVGLLQACHVRKALVGAGAKWDSSSEDFFLAEWFNVVEASKKRSTEEFPTLLEEVRRTGWAVKNVLLSPQEQTRYTLVNDG